MSAAPNVAAASSLACTQLTVEVAGRTLVRDLQLAIASGTVTCVLGCNGAGKTLTLHTLAGLRAPARGDGHARRPSRSRAGRAARWRRKLGLLTQTTEDPFPSTVLDTRADRSPSAHRLLALGERRGSRDRARTHWRRSRWKILRSATSRRCRAANVGASRSRRCSRRIPTCCCSTSRSIISIRIISSTCCKLLRDRAGAGRTVVMSLHDAGLAARFSDHALLLFGDGEWLSGPTARSAHAGDDDASCTECGARDCVGGRTDVRRPEAKQSELKFGLQQLRPDEHLLRSTVVVQLAIGRQHRRRVAESGARPSRSVNRPPAASTITASARDVENVHVGFDHDVDLARRQQVIVQEIAVAANAMRTRDELCRSAPSADRSRASSDCRRRSRPLRSTSMSLTLMRLLVEPRAAARLSAYASSPYTGADETPTISRPRCMSAICVEKNGYSRTNAFVPSIGSTSHRYSASSALCPVSSP